MWHQNPWSLRIPTCPCHPLSQPKCTLAPTSMSNKMRSAEPLKQQHLGICQPHMWLLHLPSWRFTALTVWFSLRQRAKEAQRTNPPCCYKGPRFSSIAGRLDIGGHHISHCRRIRQTKGAGHTKHDSKGQWRQWYQNVLYRLGLHVFASHHVSTHYVYSRVKTGKKVCETAPILRKKYPANYPNP